MDGFQTLALVIGWILAIFIGLLGIAILIQIYNGHINLAGLISEEDGKASLSRFQFLIFTFVIAMSLFLIVAGNPPLKFPDVPSGIFALLGISGGSYVISKGLQNQKDAPQPPPPGDTNVILTPPQAGPSSTVVVNPPANPPQ